MKHTFQKLFYLSIASILFITACKKSSPPPAVLPGITQEGKNTVGFTIDSEVWVPYARCSGWGTSPCEEISLQYYMVQDVFSLSLKRQRGNKASSLHISTGYPGQTITSIGNKIDSINVVFIPEGPSRLGALDFGSPSAGSFFNVTYLDPQNQIISGNFKFILRGYGTGEELIIDEGRFDFKFNVCKCTN